MASAVVMVGMRALLCVRAANEHIDGTLSSTAEM
jgi:hypothetical protein